MWNALKAIRLARPSELRVSREPCSACGFPLIVKLAASEIGIRCLRCGASAVTQSLVDVLVRVYPDLHRAVAYELSAKGPLVDFLAGNVATLVTSEWIEGVPPGTERDGTLCQDV
jgi:ribosomal protein L37E